MNIVKHLPPKKSPKTKHLQVRLSPEVYVGLVNALEASGLSCQDFLEAACKAFAEEKKISRP